jgi:hypothetical protein
VLKIKQKAFWPALEVAERIFRFMQNDILFKRNKEDGVPMFFGETLLKWKLMCTLFSNVKGLC